jgi:hypothetical protein
MADFRLRRRKRGVNRQRLCSFLFTGKERGRLITAQCEYASTSALQLRPFSARAPHRAFNARSGGYSEQNHHEAVIPVPRVPVHCLGLAQQRLAFVYGLGSGAPVGVLNTGTLVPHTCARAVVTKPAARLARRITGE